ncbi:glycosyl hydrolase [Protomyces lactucae-debilis]|uniref:Glycosyl hydrolase n=1 Tax=Protomyces lactucae-debilis TaxID=2754530 RepID=A0A1Y2FK58_PROLT|nr:glycosyl hydrolase [Protomyces lactucae-debilis]ORY84363.1 glycosyl hydrolase [Protomyces lactucae-debilis]
MPPHQHDALITRLKTILLAMQRASWEQALAAQALYEWRPDEELPSIVGLAYDMIARSDSLGRLGVLLNETDQSSLDFCAIGECLVFLHHQTRDTIWLSAARSLVGYIRRTAGRSFEGLLVHRAGELWVDALYMLPPALIATGSSWNQDSLIFEGFQQLNGYEKYLRDQATGLWSQSWNIESHAIARREHLSTGNGWAMAGCVRVLSLLPKEGWQEEAEQLAGKTLQTLRSVLAHQRPDGLFHFVLEDETSFVECTSAAMYAYSIYTLQLLGLLSAQAIEVKAADRMTTALIALVDQDGHLRGCVLARKDGHEGNMQGRGTSAEGQAFLIMALAAAGHLQGGGRHIHWTHLQAGSQENVSMYEEV